VAPDEDAPLEPFSKQALAAEAAAADQAETDSQDEAGETSEA
jgi:hypothetical protein